jgi:ubiquinone/menaquinone biosynthesis C-methylase UbiE
VKTSRAVYDEFADRYESVMQLLERWFLARLRQRTFAFLPSNGRILELGAGTGLNFAFYPRSVSVAATEPSPEMLRIAAQKERPEGVRLVQSRAEQLPFHDGSFDAAVATLVMCSVESPAKALVELRRIVRPGGTVVLLDHVRPDGLMGPVFDLLNSFTSRLFADHFNRRTADEARAAGLEVTTREKHLRGIINLVVCRV